jgi:hypothetical protein
MVSKALALLRLPSRSRDLRYVPKVNLAIKVHVYVV